MEDFDTLYGTKYLSAGELKAPVTAMLERIEEETFARPGETSRTKKVAYFKGGKKGVVINKTNANNLAAAFGKNFAAWEGQRVTIKPEPISFGGRTVMGVRLYPANGTAAPALKAPEPKPSLKEEMDDDIGF